MDPDFVRYQADLARTIANNNRLAGIAIIISVISLAVAIFALLRSRDRSPLVPSLVAAPSASVTSVPEANKGDGSIAMKPTVLVEWLNRIVTTETIEGARFDYRLEYMNEARGYIEARWRMVVDATPESRRLLGNGIAAYHRKVDGLLEPLGLIIQGNYNPGQPVLDEVTKTIKIDEIMSLGPRWRPTSRQEPAKK